MKKLIKFFGVLFIISCNNQQRQSIENKRNKSEITDTQVVHVSSMNIRDTITYSGVLLIYTDSLQDENKSLKILNKDNSIFATIISKNDNEPADDKLKGEILAYFPDNYIIHFDANKVNDDEYIVKVGSSFKIIKAKKYTEYLSISDYVLRFFLSTTSINPLRKYPSESTPEFKGLDYKSLSFKSLEIMGDWVKVTCNKECEGCSEEKIIIEGWVRWRKNGKIIIKQHYIC